MRNLEFEKRDDTYRYLNRTICRYKQEFVYVTVDPYHREGNVCEIMVTPFGGKKIKILSTDDDFSVYMPELGYINTEEGAYYIKRKPTRTQRAGLPIDMIRYHDRVPPSGREYIASTEGLAMLKNEYPSFEECLDKVDWHGIRHMAFHKHLCVAMPNRYSKVIEYRGDVAALMDPRTQEWYIPQPRQDTSFIRAILLRNGVKVP